MSRKQLDHTGSSFESFLEEEGLLKEVEAIALKRVFAWQLKTAMKARNISKKKLAEELETSRTQVERLLDPANVAVSLGNLTKAAAAVGKQIKFEMVDKSTRPSHKVKALATRSAKLRRELAAAG